jgi:hypothetical protein
MVRVYRTPGFGLKYTFRVIADGIYAGQVPARWLCKELTEFMELSPS